MKIRINEIQKVQKKINSLMANPLMSKRQEETLTGLSDTASKLMDEANIADYGDIKRKYEILHQDSISNSQGALFAPESINSFGIDLVANFDLIEDYTADGVQITPSRGGYVAINSMSFTDKGIEKLLTFPAIKEYINSNWLEFLEYELEEAKRSQGGAK